VEIFRGGRKIIASHTPPEGWLNEKGGEGWELVVAIHRGHYTELFFNRNEFEQALSDLKGLQKITGTE
jgi:hypothetical protein